MSLFVGTTTCYMTDAYVTSGKDLNAIQAAVVDRLREIIATPIVMCPSGIVTHFAYGRAWRQKRTTLFFPVIGEPGDPEWDDWTVVDESWLHL